MLPGMIPRSPAPRPHRALARDQHVLAEVVLARDVVVVAVHRLVGGHERRDSAASIGPLSRIASIISSRFIRA